MINEDDPSSQELSLYHMCLSGPTCTPAANLMLVFAMFCCNCYCMLLLQADISDVLPCPLTAIGALQDKRYTAEQVAAVLPFPAHRAHWPNFRCTQC